jgi:signal transduction histidine kinase
MELDVESVSLRELLDAALVMQREKALRHGIKLDLQIEPDHPIVIEADERKLKQIVFNLLSNAVKFTADGGSVRVAARRVGSQELGVGSGKDSLEKGVRSPEKERMYSDTELQLSDFDYIEITIGTPA